MKQVNTQNHHLQALTRATRAGTLPTVHDNPAIYYPAVDVNSTPFAAISTFSSPLLSDPQMHPIMQDDQPGRRIKEQLQ